MAHITKTNSPLAQLFKEPAAVPSLKKGDLVNATYIGKTKHAYFFDLGKAVTGIVYGLELMNAYDVVRNINPGDAILAKVVDPENDEGYAELSINETTKHKAWQELQELKDRGEPVTVTIASANTGGLIASVNDVKAFLPVSQLSAEHYPRVTDGDRAKIMDELKKFIGQELTVKILDFNQRTGKLILSERGVVDENAKEQLAKYAVGDIVNVIVSGVADFGVFVKFADNLSVEGLIHISELDHRLIEDPREIVAIGDLFKAQITEIKDGRVSLSLKALKENPWDRVTERYSEGARVAGTVHRFNQLGAVIKLDADFQGLIRAADFGGTEAMEKALSIGAQQSFIIEKIKPAEKRIMLKLPEGAIPTN
jgi:small subunit ribosomal protein S1